MHGTLATYFLQPMEPLSAEQGAISREIDDSLTAPQQLEMYASSPNPFHR